jgi:mono/diheme cytochrome c family protein
LRICRGGRGNGFPGGMEFAAGKHAKKNGTLGGIMKKSMIIAAATLAVAIMTASAQDTKAPDAKALYEKSCQKCHGADGKGDGTMGKRLGCKDYTDPKVQDALKDDVAFKSIKEGLKKDDKVQMSPITGLTDDQIKDVVKYMRTFKKK